MRLKIKRLSDDAFLPRKAHAGDSAFDVCIPRDTVLRPGRQKIELDIALELPEYHQAQIEPRSGFSLRGIEAYLYIFENPQNRDTEYGSKVNIDADVCVGKIDSNYRGNIAVIINSHENSNYTLPKGLRIAQMTIYELLHIDGFDESDELSETDRGNGGFCSSGTQWKPS